MPTSRSLQELAEEYRLLVMLGHRRALADDEKRRLEEIREVLLEASTALEVRGTRFDARCLRAPLRLEVSFPSLADMARAYTRDVGTGGIGIATPRPLPEGTELALELHLPGWGEPMAVKARVAWSRAGAMGLAFRGLTGEQELRLKEVIAEHTPVLDRVRSLLASRSPDPVEASVSPWSAAVVLLGNEALTRSTTELLALHGCLAVEAMAPKQRADVLVADGFHAPALRAQYAKVPLVLVLEEACEPSDPRVRALEPAAVLSPPVTAANVVQATRAILKRPK